MARPGTPGGRSRRGRAEPSGRVKEQSHKDEMSAALRGDFQRLRERGVAVSLAPPAPESEPEAPSDTETEPAPQAGAEVAEAAEEPRPKPEPEPAAPVVEPAAPVVEDDRAPQPGWLDRLFGREPRT